MMDSLPDRKLSKHEFDSLKEQNHRIHSVIGGHSGDVSGLMIDSEDGEESYLILWSLRDEEWVHYDTLSRELDVEQQGERIQEFISVHYPDDHVLNEEGKGFGQ